MSPITFLGNARKRNAITGVPASAARVRNKAHSRYCMDGTTVGKVVGAANIAIAFRAFPKQYSRGANRCNVITSM